MQEIEIILENMKGIFESIAGALEERKKNSAFQQLNENIDSIQEYILFFANNEILAIEQINQISLILVQAMQERDAVLLLDVIKYALLDVTNQLLEGYGDENGA